MGHAPFRRKGDTCPFGGGQDCLFWDGNTSRWQVGGVRFVGWGPGPVEFRVPGLSIGRDAANDIAVPDDRTLSRFHARVEPSGSAWEVLDLGSQNGTFVNGRLVSRHPLGPGDRVRVGALVLAVAVEDDPFSTLRSGPPDGAAAATVLSPRENEVLALVAGGATDEQIAASLFIGVATVRSHLDRIGAKTGSRRRADLTRLALSLGLTDQS